MRYRALDPVRLIPGVGPKVAEGLERMGITTLGDLLYWFPRRYLDASQITPINRVPFGQLSVISGEVLDVETKRTKSRGLRMLEVRVGDASGELLIRYFNQPYLANKLLPGSRWIFIGVAKRFAGETVMASPMLERDPRIIPVYAQTKGVTSRMLTSYIDVLLKNVDLEEGELPAELREHEGLVARPEALKAVHQPPNQEALAAGKAYLAFEEAFSFFVNMLRVKQEDGEEPGIAVKVDMEWFKKLVASLPFELTDGQKRVIWDSLQEMENGRPMTRLLNGDVGSGKTVVAALLGAVMAKNGYRTAVLAPTEILAKQHYETFTKLLPDCGIGIWTAAQKEGLETADIIVGTHALLQEGVHMEKLGLVVVDEQHRFGVKQRALLRQKQAILPHLLSMTATPIPRTLALVLFADLTVSFLKEKPKNRRPIITEIAYGQQLAAVHQRIVTELGKGHQVFVLCPLIEAKEEEDEGLGGPTLFDYAEQQAVEKKTVLKEVERLRETHPEYGVIEAIHGKMKAVEKREIMERMARGEINVLVATSVIEVGVDVPNATVMVIEGAERFGLAQLHQFRGRVGRSADQAYCYLCPSVRSDLAMQRLAVLVESDSGFDVAERDLELRGPGDLTGLAQSGLPDFHFVSLTNIEYLQHVKDVTESFIAKNPDYLRTYSGGGYSNVMAGLE